MNHFNFFVSHSIKLSALGDILSNQAIGIFVRATLPTGIRSGKVRSAAQSRINRLMHRKLTAVVTGDGVHHVLERHQQLNHGGADDGSGLVGQQFEKREA